MFTPWEFESERQMLIGLIGHDFGSEPEKKIPEIKKSKERMANYIYHEAKLKKNDVVLEIGSGCGFLSYWIAPKIKKLHCCDISETFLKFAKKECANIPNIVFHKANSMNLSFLEDKSLDGIYSHAVFIHLNLFDIFWYFKEFSRILKADGRVWFDIANAEKLNPKEEKYFLEMAEHYKENSNALPSLMQWNSASAVIGVAEYYGFSLEDQKYNREFLFRLPSTGSFSRFTSFTAGFRKKALKGLNRMRGNSHDGS